MDAIDGGGTVTLPADERGSFAGLTRRRLLVGAGTVLVGAGAASAFDTVAFSSATAPRTTNVSVADDPDAIIGLLVADSVRKNKKDVLVDIENGTGHTVDFTVSLDDCAHGILYGPNGSGCSVGLTLSPGASKSVEIEASVKDTTIPFTITGSSSEFAFEATRETTAVSGNTAGAIKFQKLEGFSANSTDDDWTIRDIDIRDNDGDDDLDRVEFEIEDSSGTVRATRTDACGCSKRSKYAPNGNPSVRIATDNSSYSVTGDETYKLTVSAYDVDGNSAFETRKDTA